MEITYDDNYDYDSSMEEAEIIEHKPYGLSQSAYYTNETTADTTEVTVQLSTF
jgi:hypothetical protein